MLIYPQLATGTVACFPIVRTTVLRTAINRMEDGSALKNADPDASEVRWELRYSAMSDDERSALETFFADCAGRLRSFVFLDPTGNLLAHSEDFSKPEWRADGLLMLDGMSAINGGQAWQGISQTLAVPQRFSLCFSAEVRGTGSVRLCIGSMESTYPVSEGTSTVWCSGSEEGEADEVICRLELAPGSSVELSRLSVQAQPMPGEYKRTAGRTGVYEAARFEDDRLVFTAEGPNDHSTTVRLRSRE